MKIFEYVWLASAVFLMVFLVKDFETLPTTSKIALIAGIFASSFMYSFRRSRRRRLDQLFQQSQQESESAAEEKDLS